MTAAEVRRVTAATPGTYRAPEEACLANAAERRARAHLEAASIYAAAEAFRARPENASLTLQAWTDKGRPMLSIYAEAWLCQVAKINGRALRAMTLRAIMDIPGAGNVAARELALGRLSLPVWRAS